MSEILIWNCCYNDDLVHAAHGRSAHTTGPRPLRDLGPFDSLQSARAAVGRANSLYFQDPSRSTSAGRQMIELCKAHRAAAWNRLRAIRLTISDTNENIELIREARASLEAEINAAEQAGRTQTKRHADRLKRRDRLSEREQVLLSSLAESERRLESAEAEF